VDSAPPWANVSGTPWKESESWPPPVINSNGPPLETSAITADDSRDPRKYEGGSRGETADRGDTGLSDVKYARWETQNFSCSRERKTGW